MAIQQRGGGGGFGGARCATQREAEGEGEAIGGRTVQRQHASGEGVGGFEHGRIVQQRQRLRHHDGALAAGAVGGDQRLIERGEQRQVEIAAGVEIETAAVRAVGVRLIFGNGDGAVGPAFQWNEWTADPAVELAGDGQDGVAHGLGFQPSQARVPEESVVGINVHGLGGEFRRGVRGLSIGGGVHDQAMHRLEFPAAANELGGEKLEQFRMRRRCSREAEIARRGDDPAAEVMMPEAVHLHAGDERGGAAAGRGQGLCEGDAARSVGQRGGTREHCGQAGRDLGSGQFVVALFQQERRRGGGDIPDRLKLFDVAAAGTQRGFLLFQTRVGLAFLGCERGGDFPVGDAGHRSRCFNQGLLLGGALVGGGGLGGLERGGGFRGKRRELRRGESLAVRRADFSLAATEFVDLFIEVGVEGLHRFHLGGRGRDDVAELRLGPLGGVVGGREKGEETVVVAMRDRVVLVIVAAGALHREAEHVAGENLDRVVQNLVPLERAVAFVVVRAIHGRAEKTGGDEPFLLLGGERDGLELVGVFLAVGVLPALVAPPREELIAGELFQQEAVER